MSTGHVPNIPAGGQRDTRAMSRAMAERERGRKSVRAATAATGVASAVAAGVIAVVLPGASHAAASTSGRSGTAAPASTSS
ncbi:MAG TPA: hypothetical protein VHF26_07695, partial [Trebonia sp.]|nr:hypothetical protein [Trebonia sp.]